MPQISIRVDETVKNNAEQACADMGITMSSAINIYLVKLGNERRIPFEVSADPFYNSANMKRLSKAVKDAKSGKHMSEHELIEEN